MSHPEPDLAAIQNLLRATSWRSLGLTNVDARRITAACALAWLAGARGQELGRLRVEDWRPDGEMAVLLSPEGLAPRNQRHRVRLIPALPALERLLAARLADMPAAAPDAYLLGAAAPWTTSPRGWIEQRAKQIADLSNGRVASVVDLADRFRRYVHWDRPDPATAAWLGGSTDRNVCPRPPQLDDLRRLLVATHPAASKDR